MSSDVQEGPRPSRVLSRIAIAVLVAIVVFFLWTEHRAHLFGVLPYLLLLLCPLMHLFMHRGHGGARGHGHHHGGTS